MSSRNGFTPSTLPADSHVVATCKVCGGWRYVSRALMLDKAGDVPLDQIAPRLRCIERRRDKRVPPCGGRMAIELASIGWEPPAAKGPGPTTDPRG